LVESDKGILSRTKLALRRKPSVASRPRAQGSSDERPASRGALDPAPGSKGAGVYKKAKNTLDNADELIHGLGACPRIALFSDFCTVSH
jgi:hypothetical protein